MPALLRRALQCHYCGQNSGRKYEKSLHSWQCDRCEAVNYLDANGQITDPPVSSAKKQTSPHYGRYARQTQSPDLSPQGNDIFCKQCLTNQHFYQQNLASYLPDPSDPDYNKYERNLERYKKSLEERYPQVCAQCAPRVNERLKATTYAAKADNLRRGLVQKRPSAMHIDWKRWGWQRLVVFTGGILWWCSVLGQAIWHLMGLIPVADEQLQLRNTGASYVQLACTFNALSTWRSQSSCLEATKSLIWQSFYAGVFSFWWNNKLSAKLNSHTRRLTGLGSYLTIQLLSLAIRFMVLFMLEHQEVIPDGLPESAIHGASLAFITFTTLLSLTTVKLSAPPRPNLSNHHPVHVDPAATRPAYQQNSDRSTLQTSRTTTNFPIAALANPAALPTPPLSQHTEFIEEENEMDWTPTGPSQYTQFSPQHVPEYRRPGGPNPFRGTLPPAPKAPAHKVRNPKPFIPASQERKSNFMKEIRGEIRAATGTPSDDEGGVFSFGGKKDNAAGLALGPGKMRDFQSENAATGLENLFNSAFTIREQPIEELAAKRTKREEQESHRGYVLDGDTVRENVFIMRAIAGICALLVGVFALSIAMGWVNPKHAIEALLYEQDPVVEFHQVVEEVVNDL